ncbi:MAG: DUF4153 domain-containing protein [Lachnospiraceae bacterium]|nr:DUF4153 domain-containing protein [Lachnospiraceae bacterium]
MNKFKNLLKECFSYVGDLLLTHPVTFATIAVGTVLGFFLALTDNLDNEREWVRISQTVVLQLLFIAAVFAASAFFAESSPLKSDNKKTPALGICYAASAVISCVLGSVCYYDFCDEKDRSGLLLHGVWEGLCTAVSSERIRNITLGLCIALIALGIYYSYRILSEVSFSSYMTGVFSRLFFANIVFWALLIGTGALTLIFTMLIWGAFGEIFLPIFALLFGSYYVMRCVSCFTGSYREPNAFIAVLLKYVMLIMCLIAYVIIYIYMIKITVMRDYPSNAVFEILTALFTVSMPVEFMCRSLVRAPVFLEKAVEYLPFIFIPFIFLQIYSSVVRVIQYGVTPRRYFGLLFVAFEIAVIVLYAVYKDKDKKKISSFLVITAVCAIVSTAVPVVNAFDLSRTVQLYSIRHYLKDVGAVKGNALSRAGAGYSYLKGEDPKILERYFTDDEIALLKNISAENTDREWDDERYLYWDDNNSGMDLDISGYDHIAYGYLGSVGLTNGKPDDEKNADITHMGLFTDKNGPLPSYPSATELYENSSPEYEQDLSEFVNEILSMAVEKGGDAYSPACEELIREKQLIKLDNGCGFYIREMSLTYYEGSDVIKEILFKGYIFE